MIGKCDVRRLHFPNQIFISQPLPDHPQRESNHLVKAGALGASVTDLLDTPRIGVRRAGSLPRGSGMGGL